MGVYRRYGVPIYYNFEADAEILEHQFAHFERAALLATLSEIRMVPFQGRA